MRTDARRYFDALTTDGVERVEVNGPPVAFRIWKAGANVTDHGPTVFSERSAELLMAEQSTRGNRFSIDVDHMSLDKSAPLENHQAVGWFSLAVRDGELWATDIEWVNDSIRDGLTRGAWKYMSPAYDVDDSGEVTSFLNLSLTANPATHSTTALASREAITRSSRMTAKATAMKWGDIKAALDGDDEDKKAAAYAAIQAAFPDKEPDGDEGEKKDADEPEKKETKASEDEPEKKDSEEEPEKKDSTLAAALAEVNRLAATVARLEKKDETNERKSLLASRPDFAPELVKILEKAPMSMVRDTVAKLPKGPASLRTTETTQATRPGSTDGGSRLPPEESRKLAERMGLRTATAAIGWDPNMRTTRVFPALAGVANSKKEGV